MKDDIEIERLASVGEMMRSISHQWKQPLNNIALLVLNIDNAFRKGSLTNEYMEDKIDSIEDTIEYMSQTIEDFSDYLNPNKKKSDFYISDSIEKAMELTMPSLTKNRIDIIFYAEDEYESYGRKNELTQVIIILINNAKDALLKDKENSSRSIEINLEKDGDKMKITVSDNAKGIPQEYITKIFEPYFSTNSDTKSRGLGLPMARKIIEERFNGTVIAYNNGGAVFEISLSI